MFCFAFVPAVKKRPGRKDVLMIQKLQAHLLSMVKVVSLVGFTWQLQEQTHLPLLMMQLVMVAAEWTLKSANHFVLQCSEDESKLIGRSSIMQQDNNNFFSHSMAELFQICKPACWWTQCLSYNAHIVYNVRYFWSAVLLEFFWKQENMFWLIYERWEKVPWKSQA